MPRMLRELSSNLALYLQEDKGEKKEMSEPVKVAGICISGVCCFACAAIGEMEMAYAFGGVFGALLGFPMIGKGIKKLFS